MFGMDKYLSKVKSGLDERVGEDVLAFGLFQPHGSMMLMASPLVSMIEKRQTSKAAGRKLPRSMAIAITPTQICGFGVKDAGYTGRGSIQDEVGRWPREGTRIDSATGTLMDRLTLAFPDGTRLELEVMNLMGMRKVNEEFVRVLSGPAGGPTPSA